MPGSARPKGRDVDLPAWLRRAAAVEAADARLALWVDLFRNAPAEQAARLLAEVVEAVARRAPGSVPAYLPLLRLEAISARTGAGRMAAVLEAARSLSLTAAEFVLEFHGPPVRGGELGPPPDPVLEEYSLGHRKVLARGPRNPLMERVLRDPDPRVVREVLRNPRVREAEVVAIASRRPCPEAVFRLIAESEAWIHRPAVQRAVVRNPYAPPRLAVALLVLQPEGVLRDVANEKGLHPAVRDGALEVLAWRSRADQA